MYVTCNGSLREVCSKNKAAALSMCQFVLGLPVLLGESGSESLPAGSWSSTEATP